MSASQDNPSTQRGDNPDSAAENSPSLQAPAISLPKGGGAIRGGGEKFTANPVTGTGSMSVPIPTSPGRSGFGPQLSLKYDSGAGNGPFGFGWSLGLPRITRRTDKGLPQYDDATESDVFILSDAEDLVPVYRQDLDGTWVAAHPGFQRDPDVGWVRDSSGRLLIHDETRTVGGVTYGVRRYRPRIEGLFARIERWTDVSNGASHWRSISKDNQTTLYGLGPGSRIASPSDPSRVFTWLICQSYDDRGNVIDYRYKAEDSAGVDPAQANERNRTTPSRSVNRYLKRIRYGNATSTVRGGQAVSPLGPDVSAMSWLFEVVLDYGEHDRAKPSPSDDSTDPATGSVPWPVRCDPFSSYRAGFEVRTYRRCRRVLTFHHCPDLPSGEKGYDGLVRSTDFDFTDDENPLDARNPIYSFLLSVTASGYQRQPAGDYLRKSFPPVEFTYSEAVVEETLREVDPGSLKNLPAGLDGGVYQWTDLHGEGIPGIVTEQGGAWFYKRNLSPINAVVENGSSRVEARFAPLESVAARPNLDLRGGAQFMDLAGDGLPDLVALEESTPGLYEHDEGEGWQPFRPFTSRLNRDLRDPNLRLVDLDGDGRADVLISEDDALVWHPSLGEAGFGPASRIAQSRDEEKGPRLVFADGEESIHLADLSGDGLADLVRIRNREVCYWPNLGYGRFGAKVTMDGAPSFDHPDQFDRKRLRLADIDGSGTTDLIYLHRDGVRLYFNQSGNGWSQPHMLKEFPRIDDAASVLPVDLLGDGTACLVWSSPLPNDGWRPMRYVNLMGGRKPHLLIGTDSNLGAETRIDYAPSTRFYLQDKRDGNPWITRLPFPVQVVERVETIDHVGRNRFTTRYMYHHGYYDGEEREFRGFGMVEQWDAEQMDALTGGNPADPLSVPPMRTRTWFQTGVHLGRDHVSDYFAGFLDATDRGEYFRELGLTDAEARDLLLPDTVLPDGLSLEEEREACRALKGMMLRQEVYADDAGPGAAPALILRAAMPYSVTEQNFDLLALQPRGDNRHAVFFSHPRESINFHYERNPADPRFQQSLTLEVDAYGNVLKQATVGYGRRTTVRTVDSLGQVQKIPNPGLAELTPADQQKQTATLLTYTENRATNPVESADTHRVPLACEAVTFELTGYTPTGAAGRFQAADFVEPDPAAPGRLRHKFNAPEVPYEATASGSRRRRRIEQARTLYRRDDLTGLLPLGELDSLGLSGESYRLAFTPGLLARVFQRPHPGSPAEALLPDPATVLAGQAGDRGGYLQSQTLKADGRFPSDDADGHWWAPSGRSFFSGGPGDPAATELARAREHFFLPRRYRSLFGHDAFVDFDALDLLMAETRDPLGNRMTVEIHDYRVLQPRLLGDPNGNRTAVAFDTLGMVVGTAVMGKPLPAPAEGDSLAGFPADLTQAQLDAFFADPVAAAPALLQDATSRIVSDPGVFRRTRAANPADPTKWLPPYAATLARETHATAALPPQGLKIQISISYSDGLGREVQKKGQAEPQKVGGVVGPPRWIGSGWTIFNNKSKPVRQYEPFFSALPPAEAHHFEFGAALGVSAVLFYDPVDRVVVTLRADHTFEKSVFDPWRQTIYDANDTCAPRNALTGDPRTDPDAGGYVAGYFASLAAPPWQTWYAQRDAGALGPNEQAAAVRAAAHADTPTTAHLDALGRTFLTVARNRVVCPGHDLDGTEDSFCARVEWDIEGNQRAVRDAVQQAGDALGRVVARYDYDLLGHRIHELGMEAGARWMLHDAAGRLIRAWDSRGHNFTNAYDALRRPAEQRVRGTSADGDPRTLNLDLLIGKTEYGESAANAETLNLRTRAYRQFDAAGVAVNARLDASGQPTGAYDFKGNLLHSTRRLASDYAAIPDWSQNPALDAETFEGSTRYDALNRPVQSVAPHGNSASAKRQVLQPFFNEANLLERMDVWLERAVEPAGLIDPGNEAPSSVGVLNIDYDAKGQRQRIDYQNGASTFYDYDPLTYRLARLYTRRGAAFTEDCNNPGPPPPTVAAPDAPLPGSACGLQNLRYTYDPAGNVTHVRDDAQQTIYFRNKRVEPSNDFVYDAVYRLIQATGREHLGQIGGVPNPPTSPGGFDVFHTRLDHPGDGGAMGTYNERYVYDAVGNFLRTQHRGTDPAHLGWTRAYDYLETSLTEDGSGGALLKTGNRLTRSSLNPNGANPAQVEPCQHDAHGSIVRMPHLGGGSPGPNLHWDYRDQLCQSDLGGGGTARYVYDSTGQRVRKVWIKAAGLIEERIYLGGFEVFRRHGGPIGVNTATLERETLHVADGQRRVALVETRTLDTAGSDPSPRQLVRYQLGNHLGSASLELDEQARVISYEEYAPYGSSTYQAVRSQTETPKRYRFTGKERDEETGLYYHRTRYLAPWLGRWTSADQQGLVDGPNLYQYARGSPVILTDPGGTFAGEENLDPETLQMIAAALATAIGTAKAAGAVGTGVAGGVAVAGAAGEAAPAGGGLAGGGLAAGAAGALVAAQALAALAEGLAVRNYMQRSANIVRTGNPWGIHRDDLFPVLKQVRKLHTDPYPEPEPLPQPQPNPDPDKEKKPRLGRIYVTYTKFNKDTGLYYSGRTSATIDLDKSWQLQAEAAVKLRDRNHHIDEDDEPKDPAFGPADLDKFAVGFAVDYRERYRDLGYLAVRGREQQLIDYHGKQKADALGVKNFTGGAKTDTDPGPRLTENNVRGVAKDNVAGEVFHEASNFKFGPLAPFTGQKFKRP